ncbi:phosphoketolase [archaeon]|nr:phosphoketolase [archaeon]
MVPKLTKAKAIDAIKKYHRAANYIAAAQIYLQNNVLLNKQLSHKDIKPRLLGHWGTSPGINFVYANLQRLIKETNQSMLFVLGPGHGFPALQANLFMEGSLEKFYKKAKKTKAGLQYITSQFSWPYGFPSHSNPGAPGVILEGGELGYALATSYGAILDNPNLIVTCLVGDGEAETGPTATAWHCNKFIDPKTNGAVLPILHLNGYKISGPTIYGRMSNSELKNLFKGYGYLPIIVDEKEDNKMYSSMYNAINLAYKTITKIQNDARNKKSKKQKNKPKFPMIILRSKKGWTGIKELHHKKIEGNCLSHQVVGKKAKTDDYELEKIEKWFKSYKFEELFSEKTGFCKEIKSITPKEKYCMGLNHHAYAAKIKQKLKLPNIKNLTEDSSIPGTIGSSSMRRAGAYLEQLTKLNPDNFRLFSPDETYSNKLDAMFKSTKRAFVWPKKSWDTDIANSGKVIEMLSEHTLQGLTQGYILTGRHAILASYEAFIEIISSMADQYEKFIRVSREIPWRRGAASINYILTSSGWRQEHNGFSHQNPKFISGMLEKPGNIANVYFPPDGSSTLAVLEKCLKSTDKINVIVAGKTVEPRWLTLDMAKKELEQGFMQWDFLSDNNPDIIFAAVGDYLTKESIAAIQCLKIDFPNIKIRFINIMELTSIGIGQITDENHNKLRKNKLAKLFTKNKPVIFNYHGYPNDVNSLLIHHENPKRFHVHGYTEHGSTTTPFDMHVRNQTSRFHLCIEATNLLLKEKKISKKQAQKKIISFEQKLRDHKKYILKYGEDPEEIKFWKWEKV